MNHQSFIRAIQADPDNEIPRLVYADWLDEQGDPRGELIRIQCEIARRPDNDLERKRLEVRATEVLEDYGETWLEPLRDLGAIGVSVRCFRRGLVEHLKTSAENFLKNAAALCEIEPALTMVQLTDIGPHLGEFAKEQVPSQITSIDLSANQLTSIQCRALCGSSITNQITTLDLKFNRLDGAAVEELCSAHWPHLQRLDLSSNRIGPDGASALAHQSAFPQLKVLHLGMNRIQDEGLAALLHSSSLETLEELHVGSNGIGNESMGPLMKFQTPPALKILNLRYNRIGIEEQKRLNQSELRQRLQTLDLTGNLRPSSYQ